LPSFAGSQANAKAPPPLPAAESEKLCLEMSDRLGKGGHPAEAAIELEKARGYNPKLPDIDHRLAILHDEAGDHARALQDYQKALAAKPGDADVLNDLGYSHYTHGDWAEAEKALRQAVAAKPKYARAWVNLGMALAQQSRYEEGLEAFGKAVPPAEAHCNVAFVLMTQGKRDEAKQVYRKALEIDPNQPLAAAAMAKLDQPASKPAQVGGPG
jgi:Tfp pilus assembly protein PilF